MTSLQPQLVSPGNLIRWFFGAAWLLIVVLMHASSTAYAAEDPGNCATPARTVVINQIYNGGNQSTNYVELYVNADVSNLDSWTLLFASGNKIEHTFHISDGLLNLTNAPVGPTASVGDFIIFDLGHNEIPNNNGELIIYDDNHDVVHYLHYHVGNQNTYWDNSGLDACLTEIELDNGINPGNNSGICSKPDGDMPQDGVWQNDNCEDSRGTSNTEDDGTLVFSHLLLQHSGQGITCSASTINVIACAGASDTNDCTRYTDGYSGSVTLNGRSFPFSIATGASESTVLVRSNTVGTYALGSTAPTTRCFVGANESCDIQFSEAGFIFDVPDLTANKLSDPITIHAVKTDDETQNCAPAFTGTQDIVFSFSYSNPVTGTVVPNVNSQAISESGTNIQLDFDANAEATFNVSYIDAGQLQLIASYSGMGDETGLFISGSDTFVSSPAGLCVTSDEANAQCSTAYATCSVFKAAGETFNLMLRAVAWESDTDTDLCDNLVTPNFHLDGITLGHQLVAPDPGTPGSVSQNSFNFSATDGGSVTLDQSVSEVGVFQLTATPPTASYFGLSVPGGISTPIGRFIPHHFSLESASITNRSDLDPGSVFTYMDEDFSTAFSLSARNSNDFVTENYRDGFAKLLLSNFNIYAMNDVEALTARLNIDLSQSAAWDAGSAEYTLVTRLSRDASPTGPYDDFTLALIGSDGDGTSFESAALDVDIDGDSVDDALSIGSTRIFHGRMYLGNAHGSEQLPLPVPFLVQYYNGNSFVTNTLDQLTPLMDGSLTLDPYLSPGASTTHTMNSASIAGSAGLSLSAIGAGHQGYVDLLYDAPDALKFDWDNNGVHDNNPSARATFGIYDGSPKLIYMR